MEKQRKLAWIFLAMVLAVALTGCAANQRNVVSAYGFQNAEQALSVPNPVENEKSGEQYVTIFPIILSPEIWGVEGFSHNQIDGGVWPVLASDNGGKLSKKGYAFVTDMNFWGDHIMQALVIGRKSDVNAVICLSRDGRSALDITGKEFEFNSEKFDKDLSYQAQVFSQGMNISSIEAFWRKYSQARGMEIPANFQFVEEIRINSPRWEKFKKDLATRLTENYKMPNGEIRSGYMPLADFRDEASKNNGTTAGQRFGRSAVIPAAIEPVTLAIGTVGSILNGLVSASNGPMQGFYALAECRRGDLKPRFRRMSDDFKALLQERDKVIYQLQQQLRKEKP